MRRLPAGLAIALLAVGVARADHPFILPSSTSLAGQGNVVTFDAAGADHVFFFDHRPIQLASIKVWRPDGQPGATLNGMQGRFRSVFDVRLDQPGTWKVASQQAMIVGSFRLDGEERRVGGRGGPPPGGPGAAGGSDARRGDGERPGGREGRPPEGAPGPQAGGPQAGGPQAGGPGEGPRRQPPIAFQDIPAAATDVHLTEMLSATETFVTAGAPTTTVFTPAGKGLELEPITHPNALAAGETARFRILLDGKPAAGLKVSVVPGGDRYRDDVGAMALTTGNDGIVAIRWPAAGMYWLGVEAEDRKPAEPKAEARRMSYAATLEVMTP